MAKVPRLRFNQLLELAVLSDKYDLAKSLEPAARVWVQAYRELAGFPDATDLGGWLFIAWSFRLNEMFDKLAEMFMIGVAIDENAVWTFCGEKTVKFPQMRAGYSE